jgi:MFS family permease
VLIIGRAIQGVGTGGLNVILDIILSDLVPLRDRGVYIAITLVVLTIGTSMGPFIGGVLVEKHPGDGSSTSIFLLEGCRLSFSSVFSRWEV